MNKIIFYLSELLFAKIVNNLQPETLFQSDQVYLHKDC